MNQEPCTQQHNENRPLEEQARSWIVDRSKAAAEAGAVWTYQDHIALLHTLQRIDGLVQEIQARAYADQGADGRQQRKERS